MTEQQVRLAAKMYEMRDAAKLLSGPKYPQQVATWKEAVTALAGNFRCDPIMVPVKVAEDFRQRGKELGDFAIMWLTAAALELIEEAR